MLIRFITENHLSFKDEAEYSMIAGKSRDFKNHLIKRKNDNDIDILKSSVIYGANASGKSNLVKSIDFAKELITTEYKSGQNIPVIPFKLDKNCREEPSKFEFEYKIDDKLYSYGFTCNTKSIIEEWLFEIGKTVEKPIFERITKSPENIEIKFNKSKFKNLDERKRLEYMAEDTLPNQLFLTVTNKRNIRNIKSAKVLIDSYNWFDKTLNIIFPDSKFGGLEFYLQEDDNFSKVFQAFLNAFDTGINGVKATEIKIDDLPKDIPDDIINDIIENLQNGEKAVIAGINNQRYALSMLKNGDLKVYKLMTKHITSDSKEIFFEVNEESDGTQRLLDFIPALIDITKNNKIFIIDEIDRSLHPLLSHKLLDLFFKLSENNNSQLILATHETCLLDLKFLRKDEIWFIEKDKENSSKVYSLDEFKPRKDLEIRKGYLLGRFGAIPFVKKEIDSDWL
ncbi:MAG: ATP-binding protein [bacterium]|nr:ATP-binding protein [bacterium]